MCKVSHSLDVCDLFLKKSLPERREFLKSNGLCFGCLKHGHRGKTCRARMTCSHCNQRHPTSLHDKDFLNRQKQNETKKDAVTSHRVRINKNSNFSSCIVNSHIQPVWVHHISDPENKILVYAIIDEQSDGCFIKETTLDKLKANGPKVQVQLYTVLKSERITCKKIDGLVVKGYFENEEIVLPHAYTRSSIPADVNHIPRPETAKNWPHLEKIADQLMPFRDDVEVGLLIGTNCMKAVKPIDIIPGDGLDPYAKKTLLGWGIIGVIQKDLEDGIEELVAHRIMVSEVSIGKSVERAMFSFDTKVKEVHGVDMKQISKMFEMDFSDRKLEGTSYSYEDRKFMSIMERDIHQLPDDHYEMPLPF